MKDILPLVTLTFFPAYFLFHEDSLGLAASKRETIFLFLT
jgi:hypothetical protein